MCSELPSTNVALALYMQRVAHTHTPAGACGMHACSMPCTLWLCPHAPSRPRARRQGKGKDFYRSILQGMLHSYPTSRQFFRCVRACHSVR